MGNDPPAKVPLAIARYPRAQTATSRDLDGLAAKRKREAERAAAAVPEYVPGDGDITQQYGGEPLELARARAEQRTPEERIAHLEHKNDVLQAQLLARADASVAFGRSLAWKVITAILGFLATAIAAYSYGRHGG